MTISNFAAYVKQLWKNKPDTSTPLSAERLTHQEEGIKGNSDAIQKLAAAVVSQIVNDPNKIASMAALYAVNQKVAELNSNLSRNSQGWECQFPGLSPSQGMDVPITFGTPMIDTDYIVLMSLAKVGDNWSNIALSVANRSTTGFTIKTWNNGTVATGPFSVIWVAIHHRLV